MSSESGSMVYLPTAMLDLVATDATVVQVVDEVNGTASEMRHKLHWLHQDGNWTKHPGAFDSWTAFVKGTIKMPMTTVNHWVEETEVALGLTPAHRQQLKPSHLRALAAAPPEQREEVLKEARRVVPLNPVTNLPQMSARIIEETIQRLIPTEPKAEVIVLVDSSDNIVEPESQEEKDWFNSQSIDPEPTTQMGFPDGEAVGEVQENNPIIQKGILIPNVKAKTLSLSNPESTVELSIDKSYYPTLASYLFTVASKKEREKYLAELNSK